MACRRSGYISQLTFCFDTEEALAIANGAPFGLAAHFYTRDLSRAFGEALEVG